MAGRLGTLTLAAALGLGGAVHAQEAETGPPEARPPGSAAEIRGEDGVFYAINSAGIPYIDMGAPVLAPGEVLTVQFDDGTGMPVAPMLTEVAEDAAWVGCIGALLAPDGTMRGRPPEPCAPQFDVRRILAGAGPGSMRISYAQDPNRVIMVLRVAHNFPRMVKYDLLVEELRTEPAFFGRTVTCPVPPGRPALETWPFPIGRVILTNIRFVPEGEEGQARCE